jgi:hypothetical protein
MALGNAAKAEWRLIVWCRACGHQVEPDAAQLADRHDADTPVVDLARAAGLLAMRRPGHARVLPSGKKSGSARAAL